MKSENKEIFDRMSRLIDTSEENHKLIIERYISLCNRELHKRTNSDSFFGIYGASLAIKQRFESKFGKFIPRYEGV